MDRVAVRFEHSCPGLDGGPSVCHATHAYPAEDGGVAVFYRDVTVERDAAAEREQLLTSERAARADAERAVAALAESEARFRHLALHDALTGLVNRTLFADRLAHALDRASRDGTAAAVLYVDLDGFKPLNDRLGHVAGDQALMTAADPLRLAVRVGDSHWPRASGSPSPAARPPPWTSCSAPIRRCTRRRRAEAASM